MRIMTWNVQGRVGDWEARHGALRSWIEQTAPDVLTLQESWVEPAAETVWASDHFAVVAEVTM